MKNFYLCRIAALIFLCLTFCLLPAQDEPDMNTFIPVEVEPKPLNMQDIQMAIGYPKVASDAGIEGTVIVRILIDTKGNYVRHVVLNEAHPALEEAVVTKIPDLTFEPAQNEGKPVNFWINLPFAFKLPEKTEKGF